MWAADNKLFVLKGYFGFRAFYKSYRLHERLYPNSTFVIHFRIATSGLYSVDACHPHRVNKNLAFVHNGILTGLGNLQVSDTQEFAEILKRLPTNFLSNENSVNLIDKYAEVGYNKFVFLDNLGRMTIFNEKAGYWEDDKWFSNSSGSIITTVGFSSCYSNRRTQWNYEEDVQDYIGTRYCSMCYSNKPASEVVKVGAWKFICNNCYSYLLNFATITCPKCSTTVVLQDGICPVCCTELTEEDIDTVLLTYINTNDELYR